MRPDVDRLLEKLDPADQGIVLAILQANRLDEQKIIDDIIEDINTRRSRLFDPLYIDLSKDRSQIPQEISGAGTFLGAVDASDNLAEVTISFESAVGDATQRFRLKQGKRLRLPYTRFYLYNDPQPGKWLLLLRARSLPSLTLGVEDDSGESANSDLVQALGNASSADTGQVTVTTASGQVLPENSARKRVTLANPSGSIVYIAIGEAATAAKFMLLPNSYLTLNNTGEIRAIVAAGTVDIGYLEE